MRATIFDGNDVKPCTVEMAKNANSNTNLTWVDIRLDSLKDPGATEMFEALGISAEIVYVDGGFSHVAIGNPEA